MPEPFIFTDESGVVSTDPTQPFFGIGLLKLRNVGKWNHNLNRILDQATAAEAAAGRGIGGPKFEFKFNRLNTNNYPYYEQLLAYYLLQDDAYFNAFVVDKGRADINIKKVYPTSWDALLGFSYQVINANIRAGERAIVVSDNYQKPRTAPQFYEDYLIAKLGDRLVNATMAESTSSMLLQLVDVLLGSVMYHFKRNAIQTKNLYKSGLADFVSNAYGRKDLCGGWTAVKPNYFSVWPFTPRNPA